MLWIKTAICSHTSATVAGWHTVRNPVRADAPACNARLARSAAPLLPHDRFSRRHYVVIGFFGAVLCQFGFVGRELFEINYSRCLLR
jgi:hypothetical protein